MHLFALHLRRTVLGLRLKRIEREFVIKDDSDHPNSVVTASHVLASGC